ncbi:MAG: lipopolysaccharide biosynthesis protein [Clostridia bacterium]|nr:lipopolysaccharide biosynthesis protein [Clostridia bacterium]
MSTDSSLKNKTVSSLLWKFGERISAQLVSMIVSIVLARLLTPDDYGVVGIIAIFFAFANVLISGGFNAALIQKKDANIEDYSNVLFISLISSTIVYLILFFCAPYLAHIYDKEILVPVIRVMGITLFISAFKSVLCAYISSRLQFKKFFLSTIVGTIISAVVGIVMAAKGYGCWALVGQQMTNVLIDTLVLYFSTRVRFVFKFTPRKAKGLFRYGWKILVASEISVLYEEINPLIIGVKFSAANLAFYAKGKSFPNLINASLADSLSAVLFPVMAKIQDDKEAVLRCTRNYMRLTSFVIFPAMIGFLAIAENFVLILLTEKWLPTTIYIQMFCIVYMFNIIQVGNLQVIRAIGRSDIILKLEIIKKSLYSIVILLFVFLTNDPVYLGLACIVNTGLATVINTYPNKKLIGYKYSMQLSDLIWNFLTAIAMGAVVWAIGLLGINLYLLLILQVFTGVIVYTLLSLITKNPAMKYFISTIKSFFAKRRRADAC